MAVHIGKKIKDELYKQGISVSVFAKKINRSRNVVYDIFERESVDTELLQKIGEVLKFNFFSYYQTKKSESSSATAAEDSGTYHKSTEYLKLLEQKNNALEKEVQYLKKIIALLESEKPEVKNPPAGRARKKGK